MCKNGLITHYCSIFSISNQASMTSWRCVCLTVMTEAFVYPNNTIVWLIKLLLIWGCGWNCWWNTNKEAIKTHHNKDAFLEINVKQLNTASFFFESRACSSLLLASLIFCPLLTCILFRPLRPTNIHACIQTHDGTHTPALTLNRIRTSAEIPPLQSHPWEEAAKAAKMSKPFV